MHDNDFTNRIPDGDGPITKAETDKLAHDPALHEKVYTQGVQILMTLLAGPHKWESMDVLAVETDVAMKIRRFILANPEMYDNRSWLDTQKTVVDTLIKCLFAEFADWAENNGRGDLLVNSIDLINASLPADKRILPPATDA